MVASFLEDQTSIDTIHHIHSIQRNRWRRSGERCPHPFEIILLILGLNSALLNWRRVFDIGMDRLKESVQALHRRKYTV